MLHVYAICLRYLPTLSAYTVSLRAARMLLSAYALPGTDIVYAAIRLRTRYVLRGSDIGYGAGRHSER
eukprot:569245-Rhodomonas_salina.1